MDKEKYEPIEGTPPAIICDLDGTLSDYTGLRGPYEFKKCANDRIVPHILSIIRLFAREGYHIIYCTGRDSSCRYETEDFLATYKCPKGMLLMKETGDQRPTTEVKLELFDKHIRSCYNVKFVLEDRTSLVKMWRENGINCLQVAEGDF